MTPPIPKSGIRDNHRRGGVARMALVDIAATGADNLLNTEQIRENVNPLGPFYLLCSRDEGTDFELITWLAIK
jgi:hypothetical protein